MYKSPLGPPFIPDSPSPFRTIVCSLSIPAGTVTFIFTVFLIVPFPLHYGHFSSIFVPSSTIKE